MGKYYAVKKGRKTGIFTSWDECKAQVDGFSGAVYKSFKTKEQAEGYLDDVQDGIENTVYHDKDLMTVYVDGSYNNSTGEYSYGLIAFVGDEVIRDCKAYNDEELAAMRNVAGEIKGAEAGINLALAKGCKAVRVYHDYEGIAKWPLGEWKANKKGTIAYKKFYDEKKADISISFHKVTGHSGDVYNDEADRLAKSALGIE